MKIVVEIIFISLLVGCSSETEKTSTDFYNIEGLNADIKADLDINLLEIKKRTDSIYLNDEGYYIDLIEEMSGGVDKNCFERAGIPLDAVDTKGVHLNRTESKDSLARLMMLSFAKNVYTNSCSAEAEDSLCIYKLEWKSGMEEIDPREAMMGYSFFFGKFRKLYDKNYLSDDEFHYMILYLHYLAVLTATELNPNH